jgi:hypothetical protein
MLTWYVAQLDADEAIARAAKPGPWGWNGGDAAIERGTAWLYSSDDERVIDAEGQFVVSAPDARHIERHDPRSALALVAAHRSILFYHSGAHECSGPDDNCMWILDGEICPTVRALVSAFAGREGYLPEWGPR